jgi:tight adherence protein B
MTQYLLPMLIAASVALAAYALFQLVVRLADAERRKLKQRLSGENRPSASGATSVTIHNRPDHQSGLDELLSSVSMLSSLRRHLIQAYPDATLSGFMLVTGGCGLAVGGLVFILTFQPLVALVGAAIGAGVPMLVLSHKRARRQSLLADQLPEALDFMSRILRAGHSLSTSMQMMADELPKPLSTEFRRAYDQHSLGVPLEDALRELAARVDSSDFAFFVTAVLIQRQTGGDLAEVLNNISNMIRQRIRLQEHVKAKTAEGRFTGYILSAFPAVMFVLAYMMNPDYAGVLIKEDIGLTLLGIAFFMQMMGLLAIRKITTVEV